MARQALSPATIRSYDLAVAKFKAFLKNHGQSWDAVNEHSVLAYLFYLHQENCAASTIAATLSALAFELKIQGLPDYTKNFKISQLLVAMRKMGGNSDRRKPITPNILSKLVESLSYLSISHYERVMFKAIFLCSFAFALRLGEYTESPHTLLLNNISISAFSLQITFSSFKHSSGNDLLSHTFEASFSASCPVLALNNYLQLRGTLEGPLFILNGKAIPKTLFSKILRQAVSFIGLPPACFTSHSFRIGATTTWAQQGVSEVVIRRRGRWKNSAAMAKYIRMSVSHN